MLLVLVNGCCPDEMEFRVFFLMRTPPALEGLRRRFMRRASDEKHALLYGAAVWTALELPARLLRSWLTWNRMRDGRASLGILPAGTALWPYLLLRTFPDRDERGKGLRRARVLLALFCFWMLGEYQLTETVFKTVWYSLYWYSLPLVYAGVLRLLGRKAPGNTVRDLAYSAFCTLVFWDNMFGSSAVRPGRSSIWRCR